MALTNFQRLQTYQALQNNAAYPWESIDDNKSIRFIGPLVSPAFGARLWPILLARLLQGLLRDHTSTFCAPKISNLALEAAQVGGGGFQQHVGGLEVAVQDSHGVQVRHAGCHIE